MVMNDEIFFNNVVLVPNFISIIILKHAIPLRYFY